jgi:archaellum component FlaF (FlaF/FlaG flagellin family)
MGFSLIASFTIIGISILIAIEIFSGNILPTYLNMQDSYDDMIDRDIDRQNSNIEIVAVTSVVNNSNYDYFLNIQNNGSFTFKSEKFDVLYNGVSQEFSFDDIYIIPNKNTTFSIFNITSGVNQRFKIIAENGVSDYYTIN